MSLGIIGSAYVAPAVVGTYYEEVTADSPVFYFPLGDSSTPVVDAVGSYPTTSNDWPTLGAAGIGDDATSADFNGTSDHFLLGYGTAVTTFSVEALVAVDSLGVRSVIGRGNGLWLLVQDGTPKLGAPGSGAYLGASVGVGTSGVPHHIAGTYDGSSMRIFVDGVERGVRSGAVSISTVSYDIGRRDSTYYFDGKLAGVALYSSSLSASRILAHARAAGVA